MRIEIEHESEAWHRHRAGKINASEIWRIMQPGSSGTQFSAQGMAYAHALAAGIMTGAPVEQVTAASLRWGKFYEPLAAEAYTLRMLRAAEKPNAVWVRPGTLVSGSPDLLVGPDRGVEIKCPASRGAHFATLMLGDIPPPHVPQVMCYMWLTERDVWDFVSYDPRYHGDAALFVKEIPRNDGYITNMALRVNQFQEYVFALLKKVGFDGDPFNPPAPVQTPGALSDDAGPEWANAAG